MLNPAGSRISVSWLFGISVIIGLLLSLSKWHDEAIAEILLEFPGFLLIGIAMAGRIWSGSYICGFKNERLITTGPYSISRNPLYFFSFVGGLGVSLLTKTTTVPLLFVLFFWSIYPSVIAREEAALRERHGAAFEAYCRRVPRFFPRPSLYDEPEHYAVCAARFRRFLTEVIWLVFAAGIVRVLENLHCADVLPILFRLY